MGRDGFPLLESGLLAECSSRLHRRGRFMNRNQADRNLSSGGREKGMTQPVQPRDFSAFQSIADVTRKTPQSGHSIDELCINTIRTLSMDAVQKANSGHPGTPMALAPAAFVLWDRHLRHNPSNPQWPNRDRFVLSAGHASMLLYSILYLCGYGLELSDLESFRQLGSPCAGHPEYGAAPGIEATTGPLGQG